MVDTVTLTQATGPSDDNVHISSASGTGSDGGFEIRLTAGDGGLNAGATGGSIYLDAGVGVDEGGYIEINCGNGTGNGGDYVVTAGNSTGVGSGGSLRYNAGAGGITSGDGGNAIINSGNATEVGDGGVINFGAGLGGGTSGDGGGINFAAGNARANDDNGGSITLTPGAANGTGIAGHILIVGLEDFLDDTAAAIGGVPVNGLYRTASAVKVRVS